VDEIRYYSLQLLDYFTPYVTVYVTYDPQKKTREAFSGLSADARNSFRIKWTAYFIGQAGQVGG
jgi:hypothetical protein